MHIDGLGPGVLLEHERVPMKKEVLRMIVLNPEEFTLRVRVINNLLFDVSSTFDLLLYLSNTNRSSNIEEITFNLDLAF